MRSSRRGFLKTSLGFSTLLSLAPSTPGFLARAAMAAGRDDRDTVLIVVQLAGGNDGLNTVVPYADDEYARHRSTLRLTAGQVLKIDSQLGLHPRMPGFLRLLREGHLSILQGVGYPNPHPDHFQSMHIWQTASPQAASSSQTGWLGRAVDSVSRPDEVRVPAVFVGQIERPFALNAQRSIVPSLQSLDQWTVRSLPGPESAPAQRRRIARVVETNGNPGNPLLDFVQRSTLAAQATSRQVETAANQLASGSSAEYPPIELARRLRMIAQLIRADLGIRIFFTELGGQEPGGFDNHAAQRDNHAALLGQLSDSVAALAADLARDKLLDRVLLMTFSEFGRTTAENGRRGTDHGSAAPLFLVGGRVRGGLIGPLPDLRQMENGGQKHHTDFRRVYATVLERWLGLDSQSILGAKFPPLDVLQPVT